MSIHLSDFGVSYALALQKVIGEVKHAVTKYDRIHDDAHMPMEWTGMLNQRAQNLHALAFATGYEEMYEKELLALAALTVSALACHERQKGRTK
jgi:hypothetical protein